jgi:hypothetical protein
VYTVTGTNQFGCSAISHHTILVSECVGLDNLSESNFGSYFYPNPCQGKIVFNFTLPENTSIFVYNQFGQKIGEFKSTEINLNQKQLDLSELGKGIYFLKIETETFQFFSKLIIQ